MIKNIWPYPVILVQLLFLICSNLFGQLNFTVNSLADDNHAFAWDNPATTNVDESVDGICNDELGRCTLRAAIDEATKMKVPVNITFNVGGTINLQNTISLPDGSTIDGGGQVELISVFTCLNIKNNTTVEGLSITTQFVGAGLSVEGDKNKIGALSNGNEFIDSPIGLTIGGDSNEVYSNYFGLDKNNALHEDRYGMIINGHHNQIGKGIPLYSNIICGSFVVGIEIGGGGQNEILFNYIGTTPDGMTRYGNNQGIIVAGSDGNVIGGANGTDGNIISGNTYEGIFISGVPPESNSLYNIISNNIIGLSPLRNVAIPNGNGIVITGGAKNEKISDNIIAGNNQSGILIFGLHDSTGTYTTSDHIINGNKIGTNENSIIFPNQIGITIRGNAENITIGSDLSSDYSPNLIIGNKQEGIYVLPDSSGISPKNIWFRKNIINQNLVSNLLVDPSANLGIQPPNSLSYNGGTLAGIHQIPNVVIDIYEANKTEGPPSAYRWLGSTTTDANGVFAFDFNDPLVEAVTTTASTSSMGTSSFAYLDKFTGVENKDELPKKFSLDQNYPNPFNPITKIKYTIPSEGTSLMKSVQLKVYDVLGNEVATLVNEEKRAGNYEITFNAANLPSGIYFYQLKAGEFVSTKKLMLLK
jgi:hypothetical protein